MSNVDREIAEAARLRQILDTVTPRPQSDVYDYAGWTFCPECGAAVHNSASGWEIHEHIKRP